MYNYRIVHIKGTKNKIADCLSRIPSWLANKDKNLKTINIVRCLISSISTDRDVISMA